MKKGELINEENICRLIITFRVISKYFSLTDEMLKNSHFNFLPGESEKSECLKIFYSIIKTLYVLKEKENSWNDPEIQNFFSKLTKDSVSCLNNLATYLLEESEGSKKEFFNLWYEIDVSVWPPMYLKLVKDF